MNHSIFILNIWITKSIQLLISLWYCRINMCIVIQHVSIERSYRALRVRIANFPVCIPTLFQNDHSAILVYIVKKPSCYNNMYFLLLIELRKKLHSKVICQYHRLLLSFKTIKLLHEEYKKLWLHNSKIDSVLFLRHSKVK